MSDIYFKTSIINKLFLIYFTETVQDRMFSDEPTLPIKSYISDWLKQASLK